MTNTEKYNTILSYWQELPSGSLDEYLRRIDTGKRIYNALLTYNQLCLREGKEVRM